MMQKIAMRSQFVSSDLSIHVELIVESDLDLYTKQEWKIDKLKWKQKKKTRKAARHACIETWECKKYKN